MRRRVVELVAAEERPAGKICELVAEEFGISQPATSRHLRVLREAGLVRARVEGSRRLYSIDPSGLQEIEQWLLRLRGLWVHALSDLETEVARGAEASERPSKTQERQ